MSISEFGLRNLQSAFRDLKPKTYEYTGVTYGKYQR